MTPAIGNEPAGRAKVLVVNAEPVSRILLAGALAARGFDVAEADCGEECLRRLDRGETPEIVLLDVPLDLVPGLNGLEVLRPIRERWPMDLLPVIAVTALSGPEHVIAALKAGANDHVFKTVDLLVLVARMQASLDLRRLALERRGRERSPEAPCHQAAAASVIRDRFLALLSHELRAPLTPMLLAAETLEGDPELPLQHRKAALAILHSVELESRLIENLLDATRIANGKLELRLAETDAEAVLRAALSLCEGKIRSKAIEVSLRLEAPDHRVQADSLRLQQVLWNLLYNSAKFTPAAGRITIRSWSRGDWLGLEVADTGIGIEPDVLLRIFDPFEQGSRELTRSFGGLGLGLSISKSVVEAHGGRLTARSEGRGCGAAFTLELPRVTDR